MKIRKPWMIKLIGLLGALVIRLWLSTVRSRYHSLGKNVDPRQPALQVRYIYVFWHENILLPCYLFARRDVKVLISQHADGEMIAQVCRHVGFGTIRGSSTRGGIQALRKMLRASQKFHIAVIPDGPRGPRRQVESGVIYLASRTGLPIAVVGIGYERPWRLSTWDRFALPRPWSKARIVTADPLVVPPDLDKDGLEQYRQLLQRTLDQAGPLAEEWANR